MADPSAISAACSAHSKKDYSHVPISILPLLTFPESSFEPLWSSLHSPLLPYLKS
jgi:hypothetical protein